MASAEFGDHGISEAEGLLAQQRFQEIRQVIVSSLLIGTLLFLRMMEN